MSSRWEKLRKDFPISQHCVYLDHAAAGPLPTPVLAKATEYYQTHAVDGDYAWLRWMKQRESIRRKIAEFIHADPSEITFTQSTSHGMNLIAELVAGEGGVLTNNLEFPSSTLPWLWRKPKMVFQKGEHGRVPLSKMRKLLTSEIKTIVSSYVQYATGYRQDLETLGKMKGNRFLVVNATQGFGAMPINVKKWNADFMCTNSYKWMMAGYGGGVLFIKKKWLKKFAPGSVGWRSMNVPEKMDNRLLDVRQDAGRYEMGCPSMPTIAAVGAAVDYFSSIGVEKIENRILTLTHYLIRNLEKKGFEVITPKRRSLRSGIVVFKMKNAQKVWKKLLDKRIHVSPRGPGIRVAPHFYNTFEELDIFLKNITR